MISSVSGVTEAPAPSSPSQQATAPAATAASLAHTLAAERMVMTAAGTREAATRYSNEAAATSDKPVIVHARSLDAIDDVVVRNLLDSLSPTSRVAGSFFLSDQEDPAPKSLIATYYDDV